MWWGLVQHLLCLQLRGDIELAQGQNKPLPSEPVICSRRGCSGGPAVPLTHFVWVVCCWLNSINLEVRGKWAKGEAGSRGGSKRIHFGKEKVQEGSQGEQSWVFAFPSLNLNYEPCPYSKPSVRRKWAGQRCSEWAFCACWEKTDLAVAVPPRLAHLVLVPSCGVPLERTSPKPSLR